MKKNTKEKGFKISTTWLVILTVLACLAIAIFTNKTVEFNNINTNDLQALYKGSEKSIVFIGRPDCSYCQKYMPILNSVASEYNLKINYYNINEVSGQDEYNTFTKIDPYFASGEWGTPLVVVVGNNKMDENKINGLTTREDTITYFKKEGFIK